MKKTACLLIMMICLSAGALWSEYYLQFDRVSEPELQKLSRLVSIDKLADGRVYAYASQKEYDLLLSLGYGFEVIPGPLSGFEPEMSSSLRELRDWDYYPTYDAYIDLMYEFATEYPEICEVYSTGTSVEGREVLVAHIGDDPGMEDEEPEFYYMGQIHGDELVTYIVLLHLIDDLLSGYGTDPRIDYIIEEIDLYINPLCNPDGTYAGGNHTVAGATRSNANEVDLNRNFADPEDGLHPDGNEYQPETLIQMEFAAQHSFVMCANLHSGAEVVNYPWDTWPTLHADDDWWQQVANTYVDAVHAEAPSYYMDGFNNGITNGYQWYTTSGSHQDYMNWYHRCRDVTLELSDTKPLPENVLEDYYQWNYNALLLYMEECDYGIKGTVNNSSGEPLDALINIPGHDELHSDIYTEASTGRYYRPIYSGTYDLVASAWGYLPEQINDAYAPYHSFSSYDFTLLEAELCQLCGEITDEQSGIPLFGAYIELAGTPLEAVMTNSMGQYSLTEIPAGEYAVQVYAAGYMSQEQTVTISTGTNILDVVLTASSALSFEAGDFPEDQEFYSTGDANWFVTSDAAHNGIYSARSGGIDHREDTSLHLEVDLVNNGSITFWIKVSTEEDWDFGYFYVDNVQQQSWSGAQDWVEVSYPLAAGNHHFQWEYDKDNSVSNGSDCVWVDDIMIEGLPQFPTVYGDVDDNGQVEAYDASLILRYTVEMNPGAAAPLPWQYWRLIRADLDENMAIEAYDASIILQYYLGIITELPLR